MRYSKHVLATALAIVLLWSPSIAARPISRYLGFGRILLVVTNEPANSPALELLLARVPIKNRTVCPLEGWERHVDKLDSRDSTVVFLFNHNRGAFPIELPPEVLKRTTFGPLPVISRNTLFTTCRRRQQNTDLMEVFIAAPDSSRLEREVKRLLNSTESIPYLHKADVLYCAIISSRPEYAERFISSREAIEAQTFAFRDAEAFLQAAQDNSEVYLVDRQDSTPIPDALMERMPLNPFSLHPNQVAVAKGDKGDGECSILYTAPCERFLLPMLGEDPPKMVSLPDLSSAKALVFSDLSAPDLSDRDFELVRSASAGLGEAVLELCRKQGVGVVERQRFQEIAEEMGLQASTGLFDEATAARIGKFAGAQAIMLGEVPAVVRRSEHTFRQWRARDGVNEKWAWHWAETVRGQAEVTLSLRLVDVGTAAQMWNETLSISEVGEPMQVRSEARDERQNVKPPAPSWFRADFSSPECDDELVSGALAEAISTGTEKFGQETLWPADLLPLGGTTDGVEVVGAVERVEGDVVFAGIKEGIESLRPGSTLYVVGETKVGADFYRRKKATLVVRDVKTQSVRCEVQSREAGETISESDVVTSRPE